MRNGDQGLSNSFQMWFPVRETGNTPDGLHMWQAPQPAVMAAEKLPLPANDHTRAPVWLSSA